MAKSSSRQLWNMRTKRLSIEWNRAVSSIWGDDKIDHDLGYPCQRWNKSKSSDYCHVFFPFFRLDLLVLFIYLFLSLMW